jgi:hypothetical protein
MLAAIAAADGQYCWDSPPGKPSWDGDGANTAGAPLQTAGAAVATMASHDRVHPLSIDPLRLLSTMALLRAIGRFGQLLGLGIPVFAVLLQLGGRLLPSQMLVMLVVAVCCFGIGRILEGYAHS